MEEEIGEEDAMEDYHAEFASIYDRMHATVYPPEEDVHMLLRHVNLAPTSRLLDFGCGTGSHALILARQGYDVVGLDISPAMIQQAQAKGVGVSAVEFRCCDVWEYAAAVESPGFDGFFSFSNVLNCLPDRPAMEAALRAIARLVRVGGRGVVDVWNVLPLLRHGVRDTVREVMIPGAEFLQTMRTSLDGSDQRVTLGYTVFFRRASEDLWRRVDSTHRLNLLTLTEYRDLFSSNGFAIRSVVLQHPRGEVREATDDDRLVSYVLQRV